MTADDQRPRGVGRRRGNYSQAARVLKLLDRLRDVRAGIRLEALAAEFDVTPRQMRRDLAALTEAGHELEWIDPPAGGRLLRLLEDRQLVRLGIGDRFALLAVQRVFDVLAGTPLHEYVLNVQTRLLESLSPGDRQEFDNFGERFIFIPDGGLKLYDDVSSAIEGLFDGVLRRRVVRFTYRNPAGKVSEGLLQPWAIALYRQGLYVIGHVPDPRRPGEVPAQPRVFAAERFTAAKPTTEPFAVPTTFRLETLMQGAFGLWVGGREPMKVVIDFSPQARSFIEPRIWHPTQQLQPLRDGGVRLSFEVSDLTLVVPWVLSWGALARVRAPVALEATLRREAEALLATYDAVDAEPPEPDAEADV